MILKVPFFCLIATISFGQRDDYLQKLSKLTALCNAGSMKEEAYLDSVHQWLGITEREGIFFSTDSMQNMLSLFKKITESDKAFVERSVKYYVYLANNESHQGKDGMAIYFLNQYDKANQLLLNKKSIASFILKNSIYGNLEDYDKVLDLYKEYQPYFSTYPHLIDEDSISKDAAINSVQIFNAVSNAYVHKQDSLGLETLVALAKNIQQSYLKKVDPQSMHAFVMNINILKLLFNQHFNLFNDMPISKKILEEQRQLIYADTSVSAKRIAWSGVDYTGSMIKFYLKNRNWDSTKYYINLFKTLPLAHFAAKDIATYQTEFYAAIHNYDSAYKYSQILADIRKNSAIEIANDRDKLLTAFIDADENRKSLRIAEDDKRRRNRNTVIISVLSIIAVSYRFYFVWRQTRYLKQQINQLNNDVEFKVLKLEEVAEKARKNEQIKLGMELHDNMSAKLAALVFSVDSRKMEAKGDEEIQWLLQTKNHLNELYNEARGKSHIWSDSGEPESEDSFSNTVKTLLDKAFPANLYQKEILIDDGAMDHVNTATQIELLLIIREAIINILKHAKASKTDITIYEEQGNINIIIKDNGKGFDPDKILKRKNGVGLRNIQKRVKNLNGNMVIESNDDGTEIAILFPVE